MTDMKKGIIPDEWVMPFILNIRMTYKVFGAPGDRQTTESGHSAPPVTDKPLNPVTQTGYPQNNVLTPKNMMTTPALLLSQF